MSIHTVLITQRNATVVQATAREHVILIDRPIERDGTNEGATAREMFLVSLGSCFMNNLKAAIDGRSAPIHDIKIEVIGTAEEHPKRFTHIELRISAEYEDRTQMEKLVTIAERGCLVSNTIRGSVNLKVTII